MFKSILLLSSLLFIASGCSNNETAESKSNPLLEKWSGPFGGVPAFDKMSISLIQEAMEKGMESHLDEIESIANNTEAPTFDKTILAMKKSGATLNRVYPYYSLFTGSLSIDAVRKVEEVWVTKLSDYSSKIIQNNKLFQRIKRSMTRV
jgi:peptidyl-dipeptidase Dcp